MFLSGFVFYDKDLLILLLAVENLLSTLMRNFFLSTSFFARSSFPTSIVEVLLVAKNLAAALDGAAAGVFTPWCLGGVFLPPAGLSMLRTPAGPPRFRRTQGCPAGSTGRAFRFRAAGYWCRLRAFSYDPMFTSI